MINVTETCLICGKEHGVNMPCPDNTPKGNRKDNVIALKYKVDPIIERAIRRSKERGW